VHEVGLEHPPDLRLKVAPDLPRGREVQVEVGEPGSRVRAIADEGHAITIVGSLDGGRDGDAGRVEAHEHLPLVSHPSRLDRLLAEPTALADGSILTAGSPAPDAGVEVVVPEGAL